mgnify:CR=1 FL=1
MLPLSTATAMAVISVFTGLGVAYAAEMLFGVADTPFKRASLILMGVCGAFTTSLFLLVHIK